MVDKSSMENEKRALIICYDFPPYVSVAGLRPYSWYKYMRLYGFYPIVVTRQWNDLKGNPSDYVRPSKSDKTTAEKTLLGELICAPYFPNLANKILLRHGERKFKIFRKTISLVLDYMQFFFPIGPKIELYRAAKDYLSNNKVDIIIATGEPFVNFHYASKLSSQFHIPWVADYRDPWTNNGTRKNAVLRFLNKRIEKNVLKSVSHITSVSEYVINLTFETIEAKKDYSIVLNGFDKVEIENISQLNKTKELRLGLAGSIYDWHPVEEFLGALNEFIVRFPDCPLILNFIGLNDERKVIKVMEANGFHQVLKNCRFSGKMLNKEYVARISENDVNILFNDYPILGTKIFDFLKVGKPIFLCFTGDQIAKKYETKFFGVDQTAGFPYLQIKMLEEVGGGVLIEDGSELINKLYSYFQGDLIIKDVNTSKLSIYSRESQTGNLCKVLQKLC